MMDNLHGVLRALQPERKSQTQGSEHLTVFREFLSHLDRIARQVPKPSRVKSPRVVKRKGKR